MSGQEERQRHIRQGGADLQKMIRFFVLLCQHPGMGARFKYADETIDFRPGKDDHQNGQPPKYQSMHDWYLGGWPFFWGLLLRPGSVHVSVVFMGINSPHTLLRVSLAASKLASKPPGTVWSRASPHPQLTTAHAGVTVAGHAAPDAATVRSDSAL